MVDAYALIFPGQGSQYVGMGKALWDVSAKARDLLALANTTLGYDLSELCFAGPEETLRDTANAQPAILAVSVAALAALEEALGSVAAPAFGAGHSLGEFSALVAAGSLRYEDALRLVRRRGELMSAAGQVRPGAMAAVLGAGDAAVKAACREAAEAGVVVVANYNGDGQAVISGEPAAVQLAGELAKAKGARRVVMLPVSGAFHSPLMEAAAEQFRAAVDECRITDPRWPVLANATATPLRSAAAVRAELNRQITAPVLWSRSVEYMAKHGVSLFVEVGPGQVLSGLIRRNRALRTANVGDVATAMALAVELRG